MELVVENIDKEELENQAPQILNLIVEILNS